MLWTLQFIVWTRPWAGLLENVKGLRGADGDTEGTALVMVLGTLQEGFACKEVSADSSIFHECVRRRTVGVANPLFTESRS